MKNQNIRQKLKKRSNRKETNEKGKTGKKKEKK